MKTIGIKLADGSFYPVLEDNTPSEKKLELTTAHNNQTKVMVDLYRSANCSMDDAEYIDTLKIYWINGGSFIFWNDNDPFTYECNLFLEIAEFHGDISKINVRFGKS